MLLADFCNRPTNRALVDRSTPEPGGFHHPSVRARAASRLRRATLRRSGPPVVVCLTAHQELRPRRPLLHPEKEQARSHGLPDGGVFNRASCRRPTSDAPFRPPAAPLAFASGRRSTRTASTVRSSKRAGFTTRSVFPRQMPVRARFRSSLSEPATVLAALPPTSRLPALIRSPSLSREGLDLEPSSFHPKVFEAEHRLSTSAIETTRDHNHGLDRTPLTALAVACVCSSSRAFAFRLQLDPAGGLVSRKREKPTEIPQVRGGRRILRTSHRDRSQRERYPDLSGSDTSCREQVVAQAWIASATEHDSHAFLRAHPDARRLHSARLEGPLLVLSREGARDMPHPRCLPSTDVPVGG